MNLVPMSQTERMSFLTEWVDEFWSLCKEEFDPKDKRLIMNVCVSECMQKIELLSEFVELHNNKDEIRSLKIISSRSEYLGMKLSTGAGMVLALICPTPGDITMYLTAIKHVHVTLESETPIITAIWLYESVFERKTISEASMSIMWDKQKVHDCHPDNFLDHINKDSFLLME